MAYVKRYRRKCCAAYITEYKAIYASITLSQRTAGRGWTRAYIKYEYGLDMTEPPIDDKEMAFWRACAQEIREDATHFAKLGEAEKRLKCAPEDSKLPCGRIFVLCDTAEQKTARELHASYNNIQFTVFYRILMKLDAKGTIGRDSIAQAIEKRTRLETRRVTGAIKPRRTREPQIYFDVNTGKSYTAKKIKSILNTVSKTTIDKVLGKCNKEGAFSMRRVEELLSSMVLRGPRAPRQTATVKSH